MLVLLSNGDPLFKDDISADNILLYYCIQYINLCTFKNII